METRNQNRQNEIFSRTSVPSAAQRSFPMEGDSIFKNAAPYESLPLTATEKVSSTDNYAPEPCPMLFFGIFIGNPFPLSLLWAWIPVLFIKSRQNLKYYGYGVLFSAIIQMVYYAYLYYLVSSSLNFGYRFFTPSYIYRLFH